MARGEKILVNRRRCVVSDADELTFEWRGLAGFSGFVRALALALAHARIVPAAEGDRPFWQLWLMAEGGLSLILISLLLSYRS